MSELEYEGANWVYQADITNGAGGSGDHTYTITPGIGNELEVLYGTILNGDTSTRNVRIDIDDGSGRIGQLLFATAANAGASQSFPVGGSVEAAGGNVSASGQKYMVSSTMRIVATVFAVAASQDSALGIACRITGGVPGVVEAGQSTPTININTEQVF